MAGKAEAGQLRYEFSEVEDFDDSFALTLRLRPGLKTAEWNGFSAFAEGEFTGAIIDDCNGRKIKGRALELPTHSFAVSRFSTHQPGRIPVGRARDTSGLTGTADLMPWHIVIELLETLHGNSNEPCQSGIDEELFDVISVDDAFGKERLKGGTPSGGESQSRGETVAGASCARPFGRKHASHPILAQRSRPVLLRGTGRPPRCGSVRHPEQIR